MIYILCMVTGAALFVGGFFVGVRTRRPAVEPPPVEAPLKEDVDRAIAVQQQVANMLSYTGRPQT